MRHKGGHIIEDHREITERSQRDHREIDASLLQSNGDDVAPDGVQMRMQCTQRAPAGHR